MNSQTRRWLIVAACAAASAIVAGSAVGMLDFVAPSLVRLARHGECLLFCVPTSWVVVAAALAALVGGGIALRRRPRRGPTGTFRPR